MRRQQSRRRGSDASALSAKRIVASGHSPLVNAAGNALQLSGNTVLDLSGLTLATPFDLVGIAAMASRMTDPTQLTIVPPADHRVANYLQRMDMFRHLPKGVRIEPALEPELPRFDAPVIEVTHIQEPDDVDALAEAVVPRIRAAVTHDAWRALYDILVELGENAATHGRSDAGAFIAAQYYSGRTSGMSEGFWMGVADSGIGIREHLAGRKEYAGVKTDAEAIDRATKLWVTGTPERRGLGLVIVRERAGSIGPGEVLIRSGTGEGRFFSRPSGASTARYREGVAAVQGTWIHVLAGHQRA